MEGTTTGVVEVVDARDVDASTARATRPFRPSRRERRRPGQLTAVVGPSGSGKSTLMHILAGLDRPTSGSVEIDRTEITTLGDTDLTKLRRRHIGFVFQFFNLLPMLTARENILLPLTIAGTKPDRPGSTNSSSGSGSVTGSPIDRPNCPAVSSSGWLSRARSSLGRLSCSPTSRPATSTPGPSATSWS